MYNFGVLRVAGVLLGTTVAYNFVCLSSAAKLSADGPSPKMMYDFRNVGSLDNWYESSDTVRRPGMSKGSFVIQKSQLFQRAVFFSMLNPQPNGAGFVGFATNENWDLNQYSAIELRVRAQGDNLFYKINFRHKGEMIGTPSPSYETFFKVPKNEWTTITLPFSEFKPYYRGALVIDVEPLDTSKISSISIQVPGGVYSDFKQSGVSSLEIDYIQAV